MEVSETPRSAREAFENNSIPAVRVLEKQLRASVLRDQERLRALVGGNYRELLSTAEEIVTLGERNRTAENQISALSQLCKPPQSSVLPRQISTLTLSSAHLRLVVQCLTCASKALQNKSVLLCAKLTVISRLLLKSLGEQQPTPKSTKSLRENATAIRQRLLRLIDAQLAHPGSTIDTIVGAICSYCLVTSASSGDAMKHFQAVRLGRLRRRIESDDKNQLLAEEAFRYLVTSVQMLKSLLGRPVNDALGLLQKQPILQDSSVSNLEALDVDRLHNIIPPDILSFTPYVKRVLLKQDEVKQVISSWVEQACQVYVKGLRDVLAAINSVETIFTLRENLLAMVLPLYFSINTDEKVLEIVRDATSARVFELCKAQVETIMLIGDKITSAGSDLISTSSLWDASPTQKSTISNGAQYVHHVRNSHLGIKGGFATSMRRLRLWAKQVAQLRDQFQSLEATRWQDLLEEPDEDDEDTARVIITQLSKDDPARFRAATESSIQSAVSRFDKVLHDATDRIIESGGDTDNGNKAAGVVYLLRALRESSRIVNTSVRDVEIGGGSLIPKLHDALARCLSQQIGSTSKASSVASTIGTSLIDDLPSPQTFKFLRDVCKVMADVGGTDIWSAAAVSSLKDKLRVDVLDNEDHPSYVRTEFDKAFLRAALSASHNAAPSPELSRVETSAHAYWQRTRLLFGALS